MLCRLHSTHEKKRGSHVFGKTRWMGGVVVEGLTWSYVENNICDIDILFLNLDKRNYLLNIEKLQK